MTTHYQDNRRARPAVVPGATGLMLLGTTPGTPAPQWAAATEPLVAVVGLVAAVLCLGVPAGIQLALAMQGAGRRGREERRRGFLNRPRRARRAPEPEPEPWRPPVTAGCPVAHQVGHDRGQGAPRSTPEPGSGVVDRAEADEFLRMFHAENPQAGPVGPRIAAVMREIDTTGTYRHTPGELAFGARAAWRNNARCIGRLYWRSLQVRDLRTVSDAAGVAQRCITHLEAATNRGKIRPMISVFAPDAPGRPGPRIWNEQLIRYAGYERPEGGVLGDPRYCTFTQEMIARGWRPPETRGAFDVLPLVVETFDEGPQLFPLPADVVHEVELEHPELPWFGELGMRWHAVPVISNNVLSVGGVSYPAAPFNGWYMGTEIGARNFGDQDRYDLVPVVAERLGLDTSDEATLWRDRALVEINRAVLHSFEAGGVSITDHHTESARFLTHLEREESAGRVCPADWSWIVPPMSGSQTPVFHRYYEEEARGPGFHTDSGATRRALEGGPPAFG